MQERRVIFDEDADALLMRAPLGRVKASVEEWFELLFRGGVDVLVYDCASPEIVCLSRCPHGELYGERFKHFGEVVFWHVRAALDELLNEGTDILEIASRVARSAGKTVLAEMRMSDAHHYHGGSNHPLFPQFVWDHPELCIQLEDGTPDIVLDYTHEEVRARRIAVLRDIVENYDVDGIALNWMRWCRHFAKGQQRRKAHILTQFLRDVRGMLDEVAQKRGRDRFLMSHHVAAELDESLGIGCDVAAWMKEGLADFVMPMDFLFTDFGIKTEQFAAAAQGTGCGVYPAVQSSMMFRSEGGKLPEFVMSPDKYRAAVHNLYSWGASGIACFNFGCWGFDPRCQDVMLEALAIMSSPDRPLQGRRHYHYLPIWRDHGGGVCPTGKHRAQALQFRSDEMGRRLAFRFRMADGRRGEKLKGVMIARIDGATPLDEFDLDLNGTPIPPEKVTVEDRCMTRAHGTAPYPPGIDLCVSLADCPWFAGDNELGVAWTRRNGALKRAPRMEVLEVLVEPGG